MKASIKSLVESKLSLMFLYQNGYFSNTFPTLGVDVGVMVAQPDHRGSLNLLVSDSGLEYRIIYLANEHDAESVLFG